MPYSKWVKINNFIEVSNFGEVKSHAFKTGLRNYNGCKNPHLKLTQSDVETIRWIYVRGKHCENNSYGLVKRYNVSPKTIQNIVNGNHY